MGRGTSKVGGGGGAAKTPQTPSGITYDQLMQMPEGQRVSTINNIIKSNIAVPNYLDDSDTTKVIYALGMAQKPTVVSDSQLDSLPGREIFRTVYERGVMPPPTSDAVLDQIRNGDYTQLSGSGGSLHGRALYFATDFSSSAGYGRYERNPMIMRAKINPNAKIVTETNLKNQMANKGLKFSTNDSHDKMALYALSQGIDGWYSGSYTMMVNRGALTMSSQNKSINASNWASAQNK